jgi:DNA-binding transcriptional LysR family regulator
LEFGNVEAIKRYVVAGVGIAALPAVAAEDEVAWGRLIALRWAVKDFLVVTQAVWHQDKQIPSACPPSRT